MAGIYIHIPFCKQACSYCGFHFSTNLSLQERMLNALGKELLLQSPAWEDEKIETIYFGGGTPSLYTPTELNGLIQLIFSYFHLSPNAEITIECNPDDIDEEWIYELSTTAINRVSLGVQSFEDRELQFMRRAHNSTQAIRALELLTQTRSIAISADLIYGIPGQNDQVWMDNIEKLLSFDPEHISCYQLTIEPRTLLANKLKKGTFYPASDEDVIRQFELLMEIAVHHGLEHYEISNFCKPGNYALHNTSYWQGKPYLGIGPSAHSFRNNKRWWNVASNPRYVEAIEHDTLSSEGEHLTEKDRFNEYLMTGLRTKWGVEEKVLNTFSPAIVKQYSLEAKRYLEDGKLILTPEGRFLLSKEGKHLADRIASDLFAV